MILSASQLDALRQRNEEELALGGKATHGYPAQIIRDLLHTVEHVKREKKKWQRLATERGRSLEAVRDIVERAPVNGNSSD
ncbi:hypothetical protein [Desulfocurvus sp. DL9XJH121]